MYHETKDDRSGIVCGSAARSTTGYPTKQKTKTNSTPLLFSESQTGGGGGNRTTYASIILKQYFEYVYLVFIFFIFVQKSHYLWFVSHSISHHSGLFLVQSHHSGLFMMQSLAILVWSSFELSPFWFVSHSASHHSGLFLIQSHHSGLFLIQISPFWFVSCSISPF